MKVGDKIIVTEDTHDYGVLEHDGIIISITDSYVETKHYRCPVKYPQFREYLRAYTDTFTKHYFYGSGVMPFRLC